MKWCCLCILFNSCCSCRSVASSCFCFLVNSCWLCMSVNLFCALQRTRAVHAYLLSVNLCVCALQWNHAVHTYLLSVNLCLYITVNSCCSYIFFISEPVFVHYSELMLFMHIWYQRTCVYALQWTHAVHTYLLSVNLCFCITVNSCCSCVSLIGEPVFVHYSELLLYMHFSEIAFLFLFLLNSLFVQLGELLVCFLSLCSSVNSLLACVAPVLGLCDASVTNSILLELESLLPAVDLCTRPPVIRVCIVTFFGSFVYCLSGTLCFL